jgi:hypothetical protein
MANSTSEPKPVNWVHHRRDDGSFDLVAGFLERYVPPEFWPHFMGECKECDVAAPDIGVAYLRDVQKMFMVYEQEMASMMIANAVVFSMIIDDLSKLSHKHPLKDLFDALGGGPDTEIDSTTEKGDTPTH